MTDEAIREAAREVFIERGPSAPVSLIAARLGVSHAALFGRAGSKRRLMLDALCSGLPPAIEHLKEPPRAGDAERLAMILGELMVSLRRLIPNLVVLKAAGVSVDELPASDGPPPPLAVRSALTAWLDAAALDGVIEPLDAAAVSEGILGAIESRCFHAYLGGERLAPGDDGAFVRGLAGALIRWRS